MDFVLILHTHLPFVLDHGRWPHGSDWLMEAATESYLPLIDMLAALQRERVDAPFSLSITPVVAAQLAAPSFAGELMAFIAQRHAACDDAERELVATGDHTLAEIVRWWRRWYESRALQFDALDGGIIGALRTLERDGRIELMSSAATHGFLPLLARDESIRLQLLAGRAEHERLFGSVPSGCWLPECAYRPAGSWAPWPGVAPRMRSGIETSLAEAGYRFIVVDAHLAGAGDPLEPYTAPHGATATRGARSPYGDYSVGTGSAAIRAFVRDPVSTRQVWSRDGGYPGGDAYLEFHKIRFPGGLQLWKITGPGVSLGDKLPYDAAGALSLARTHARHFAGVLRDTAQREASNEGRVIVGPFDAELFGHWWFEGPQFLHEMYRALRASPTVRAATASEHLGRASAPVPLRLTAGSWGANGDFSFWLSEQTAWMWQRMWALEDRFWDAVPAALARAEAHEVLAQAARELLLAQASDWQFMISAGEVPDYGERRFRLHTDSAESLVAALGSGGDLGGAARQAAELRARDGLFPDVLDAVAKAIRHHPRGG
jgi:1,4-alpha-glucan branching enzyme